ncbi:hypothetical protein SCATT_p08110 (plasmid) [Streptantibioticus cattleyicolor NRRL 8057 = DSM 46488]|uniref:Uncharacterized protein n=1 Tax=Streptantibioticus cattleyicolor (strain ATCC 35852 / DSM 46488 / JCM 4925 / NBRC 14057 / NRRL 8057) TaxID=1003195 RepID=G8XD58_STREN|nr:hypothetical protein SCATT_p08110 [Streptantibioticus cattleyicolor NRRL 8057 = DSM 46488]
MRHRDGLVAEHNERDRLRGRAAVGYAPKLVGGGRSGRCV